jgi:hypothetical protein
MNSIHGLLLLSFMSFLFHVAVAPWLINRKIDQIVKKRKQLGVRNQYSHEFNPYRG